MVHDTFLFHVMQSGERAVIFTVKRDGTRSIYMTGNNPEVAWPRYPRIAPYLDVWFKENMPQGFEANEQTLRELAADLTRDDRLHLWAYATPSMILVSIGQVAQAMGRHPSSNQILRQELEGRGLRFADLAPNKCVTSLRNVRLVLGSEIVERVLLYPHQIAEVLGISAGRAPGIMKRLGIALDRGSSTVVEWGKLQRVRRVAPRKFELAE